MTRDFQSEKKLFWYIITMTETAMKELTQQAVTKQGLDNDILEALSSQLLWRIGQSASEQSLVIRVGLASSAALFADFPKLRGASDLEVETALKTGDFQVEWVGS